MATQTPGKPAFAARREENVLAQAAAIPFRRDREGTLWVLLIRRRHKRRWGIPKGIIDPGQTAPETALQESLEEAGVVGDLGDQSIGEFEYRKWAYVCRAQVFLLSVTHEYDHYLEDGFRERRWFRLAQALQRKTRKGVRPLLASLPRLLGRKPPAAQA